MKRKSPREYIGKPSFFIHPYCTAPQVDTHRTAVGVDFIQNPFVAAAVPPSSETRQKDVNLALKSVAYVYACPRCEYICTEGFAC